MPKEVETPIYNKFKEIFKKANKNYKGDDPAKLYAVTFERFINKLLEDKEEMISYELAKKLKDAGFQQEGEGYDSELLDSSQRSGVNVFRENVYYPSLSELIEACGIKGFVMWELDEIIYENLVSGSTPEEAVAYLWLELNKKN